MNEEEIEFELTKLKHKTIVLVCPSFGTVSHSYVGTVAMVEIDSPILFHFQGEGIATIFHATDVKLIEKANMATPMSVVYLKGPNDYKESYQTT